MNPIKGPGVFLAQFLSDEPPFNDFSSICGWAASLGYKGIQLPTWDKRCIDLDKAAESKSYCEDLAGVAYAHGLVITELSTHLQGQLIAVNPAYDELFDAFAPETLRGSPSERTRWAESQLMKAALVSSHLGLTEHATFSGALLWQTVYPWPQRPEGLVAQGFKELGRRWLPILNKFDDAGVNLCFEIHPVEDLHDGITFEMFLDAVGGHARAHILYDPSHFLLQHLNYLEFIDLYHSRIKMFHVKDAEFNPTGKSGVYGGYQAWIDRPGRFRSPGDGQINFKAIFSKLTQYGYKGWAVLEWECCIKSPIQGAKEGAPFITDHIIETSSRAFDDFAGSAPDDEKNKRILGIQ